MKKKAGIVAFAFGVSETILSNLRIANIASQKALELEAPVYTQLDICIDEGINVEFIEEQLDNPPPTLRIARGAVRWAKRNNLTDLWIVAAEPHLWRCFRDVACAVQEEKVQMEIRICEEIAQYPEDEWFCANSKQPRTQSRESWESRERILQWMPLFIYKLLTSCSF